MKRRELQGDDLYRLMAILSKAGIKDMVFRIFELRAINAGKGFSKEELDKEGANLMGDILEAVLANSSKAKKEINELLASLYEVDILEIEKLGLGAYTKMLMQLFMSEDFKDFLGSISSFKGMMNLG